MYQKTDELNKTYITKGINDRYINKYNKDELIIPNKVKINTKKLPPQNEELNVTSYERILSTINFIPKKKKKSLLLKKEDSFQKKRNNKVNWVKFFFLSKNLQ